MVAWVCAGLAQEEQEGKGHWHGSGGGKYLERRRVSGQGASGRPRGSASSPLPRLPEEPQHSTSSPAPDPSRLLLSEENSSIWGELLFT